MTAKEKLIVEKIRYKAVDGLDIVGTAIEGWARDLCTVLTGNLRGSITHATKWKGQSRVAEPASQEDAVPLPTDDFAVRIGTGVEYASYIEFGTSKMSAQPYLRPAVKDNEKRITKIYKDILKF